jgi:hypothetical protein
MMPRSFIEETNLIICPSKEYLWIKGFLRLLKDIMAHLSIFIFSLFILHQFENLSRSDCSLSQSYTELILINIFKSSTNKENEQKLNKSLT